MEELILKSIGAKFQKENEDYKNAPFKNWFGIYRKGHIWFLSIRKLKVMKKFK